MRNVSINGVALQRYSVTLKVRINYRLLGWHRTYDSDEFTCKKMDFGDRDANECFEGAIAH